jgi:RimJ/RimL family protein N-acetyltransferase
VPASPPEGRRPTPSFAVRRLHPSDARGFCDHLKRLDGEARRLRFGNPVDDAFLEAYGERTLRSDARILGCFVRGRLCGAAELRFLTPDRREAEGAVSLDPDMRGLGLGDQLFGRLIALARRRGVRRLFLTCLRENKRMQRIARHHGADLAFSDGDVMVEIRRPFADAEAEAREWRDEGQTFVFGVLEWRSGWRERIRRRWRLLSGFAGL